MIIPFTDSRLLSQDVAVSPFTLVFERAGLAFAASIMNAIILSSVLSAGNSGMYASTRMLWDLARDGKAPKFLGKLDKRGVPVNALIVTSLVGCVAFLASFFGDGVVYIWLLNASGMAGFVTWVGIAIAHYRFRKAYAAQGLDMNALPFRAKASHSDLYSRLSFVLSLSSDKAIKRSAAMGSTGIQCSFPTLA